MRRRTDWKRITNPGKAPSGPGTPADWAETARQRLGGSSTDAVAVAAALEYFGFDELPSAGALKSAYRKKLKLVHPDVGGSNEASVECSRHREVLEAELKRMA